MLGLPLISPINRHQELDRHRDISFSIAEVQVRISAGFCGFEQLVSGTGRNGVHPVQRFSQILKEEVLLPRAR